MVEAASITFSPLKSIKVPLVVDNTADFVEPASGRSPRWPSPLRNERERTRPAWTALPPGSLYPKRNDSTALYVPIPTRLSYRSNLRPPPKIGINPSANYSVGVQDGANANRRRFILSRQLLIDDTVIFIVGTQFGGVNRDTKEIPLSQILNHVSLAELQRFENQEFLQEDIREANQLPPKSKGRPVGSRLVDGKLILASDRILPIDPKSQIRHDKFAVTSPRPLGRDQLRTGPTSSPGTPLVAIRVPAFVPSFSRHQPTLARRGPETDRSSETSEDELSHRPLPSRPQYAMVTASRLAPSETSLEGETSRDVSTSRQPSREASEQLPNRTRLDTRLPLRAASPTKPLGSKPEKGTFFDRIFQQPQSSTSSLNRQVNRLPSLWPETVPSLAPAQPRLTKSPPPPRSAFPPGFDRGRYPLLRRRRKNKNFTSTPSGASSDPVSVSDLNSLPTSSSHTAQRLYNSPTQSELEDVEMVDVVEDRDEEAEREALLRQFQPQDSHKAGPPLPPMGSRPKTPTPPPDVTIFISAQEASVLARDMLDKFHSRAQVPSIQVTTPSKSVTNRSSITPHFPRGAKLSSSSVNDGPSDHKARPDRSPSKTSPASVMKTIPIKRQASLEPSRAAGNGGSEPTSTSRISRQPPKTLPKPARLSSNNRTKLSPHPITNGSSNKRQNRSSTPNDITKYFRPKSTPTKALSSPPAPLSHGSDSNSEDPLARTSSHERSNPHGSRMQRQIQHNTNPPNSHRNSNPTSSPPPRQVQTNSDSDSDTSTSTDSLNCTIPHVQPGRPYTIPPQALPIPLPQPPNPTTSPNPTTESIVPDSEDEHSPNISNDDDKSLSVSEGEGNLQREQQLSRQLQSAGDGRIVDREMDTDSEEDDKFASDSSAYTRANNTRTSIQPNSSISISNPPSSQPQSQSQTQEIVTLGSGSSDDGISDSE